MSLDLKIELAKAEARINRLRPSLLSNDLAGRRKQPFFHGAADLGDAFMDMGDALIKMLNLGSSKGQ